MAGGGVVNTGGGKDYPGKLTMFVLLACIVAATGGLIFGYDIGISGTPFDFVVLVHDPSVFQDYAIEKESLFASATLCSCESGHCILFLGHSSPTVMSGDSTHDLHIRANLRYSPSFFFISFTGFLQTQEEFFHVSPGHLSISHS